MILWKSMCEGLKSSHGNTKWKVGKWFKHKGNVSLCNGGFHASKNIIDAMGYVNMEILARVEVRGKNEIQDDKQVWEEMKIVKAWKWEKKNSVALSIFAAELCLKNFEKKFPNDDRPRKAIEAAKKWLENPTKENESAAWSAESAAWSAESAAWSAESAAWSAESAEWSAESAARSAARSAESAESAARSAAAKKQILQDCHNWIVKRTKQLEEIN